MIALVMIYVFSLMIFKILQIEPVLSNSTQLSTAIFWVHISSLFLLLANVFLSERNRIERVFGRDFFDVVAITARFLTFVMMFVLVISLIFSIYYV